MRARSSIPKVSIRQVKAARALVGWSQDQLAEFSGVSLPTIKRLEASNDERLGGRPETYESLVSALISAGIEFIEENGGGPGVRMKKRRT
jgi:transcriptional regulator with XRE-family HTH domain